MSRQALLVLVAVALSNAATWCVRLGRPTVAASLTRMLTTRRAVLAAAVLFPLAVWTGVFLVYGHPVSGDVDAFYRPQGRAAIGGEIPNRDFRSSYMPLFPYVIGAVDRVWPDDRAIPLFIALCYAAFGLIWLRVLETGLGRGRLAASLALAAMLNGAMWFLGIGYQQDEVLIAAILAAAVLLMLRQRDGAAGLALGIGCAATKILLLVAAAGLVTAASRRMRMAGGIAAGLAPVLGVFMLLGASPVEMVRQEAASLQPASLITLAAAMPPLYEMVRGHAWIAQGAIAAWLLFVACFVRPARSTARLESVAAGLAAAWLVFLLLSPKALTSYRLVVLPFLPLLLPARPAAITAFAIYSTAVGVEYMLYEDWVNGPYALAFEGAASAAGRLQLGALLALDTAIVACEAVWLACALSRLRLPFGLRFPSRRATADVKAPEYV
ncbi:MAG TPA: glycosyltransferase 87 family protein [Vicinamibacterales bacterium]